MLRDKVSIEKPVTVQEVRALMGQTQAGFARLIGMPTSTYIRKEYGDYPWKADEIRKVSEVSGVPIMLIMEVDDFE